MSDGEDLPMISPPSDSTQIELTPQKEVRVNAPDPRRNPPAPVPKAAPGEAAAETPAKPTGRVSTPTAAGVPSPVKKSTELGVPAVKPPAPAAQNASASRPAAPAVKAPLPAAGGGEDEDPEKLLREYAERQKTKLVRLEQQLVEYRKVLAERDALKGKVETLGRELLEAKKQLDVAAKSDDVIKDLQGKVDAAILSNSILADDKEKLKKGLAQQTEHFKKAEERADKAEKALADLEKKFADADRKAAEEGEARRSAEARVAAALDALQGDAPTTRTPAPRPAAEKPVSELATRPMKQANPEASPAAKAPGGAPEEKQASRPPEGPEGKGAPPQRPPGRFSFLKK
jgi:hypothetical protein